VTAKPQAGLTLVELVVTIVVLAVALVGLTSVLGGGLARSSDTLLNVRTVALAQSYLDEILSKRFDEQSQVRGIPPCRAASGRTCSTFRDCATPIAAGLFGPDGTEARANFDDVDDYHCLDEGDGQANPLQDADGATRDGYENFRVQVAVRYIDPATGDEFNIGQTNNEFSDTFDGKLITVSVSHRTMDEPIQFSAYKANF